MKPTTSLVFTGDIGFDRYMDGQWRDEALLSDGILNFLHSGDHVIANVEGALFDQKNTATEGVAQLLHAIDPEALCFFKKIGADIWHLANNHIMDCGEEGIKNTLDIAAANHVRTLGAGMNITEAKTPVILDEAGGIGLVGVGYRRGCKPAGEQKAGCLNWHEMDMIREVIAEVKSKCRWCVVVAHGGEEFTALPTPYTRDRYMAYLDMGADIVVSHHPHVPMNYETVGEKMIFYSLGNFVFDTDYQRSQFNTDLGVLLKLNFTPEDFSFDAMGIRIDRETEHIVENALPRIFTEVEPAEYEKLIPFSAKMFIAATKRQQIYMHPDQFSEATTEEEWRAEFMKEIRSGRVIGEGLDFHIICPLAEREKEKAWQTSALKDVVDYIQEQM